MTCWVDRGHRNEAMSLPSMMVASISSAVFQMPLLDRRRLQKQQNLNCNNPRYLIRDSHSIASYHALKATRAVLVFKARPSQQTSQPRERELSTALGHHLGAHTHL